MNNDLTQIISKILNSQSDNIADHLSNLTWLGLEFDTTLPEVSIGYGFDYVNERFKLTVILEREDVEE